MIHSSANLLCYAYCIWAIHNSMIPLAKTLQYLFLRYDIPGWMFIKVFWGMISLAKTFREVWYPWIKLHNVFWGMISLAKTSYYLVCWGKTDVWDMISLAECLKTFFEVWYPWPKLFDIWYPWIKLHNVFWGMISLAKTSYYFNCWGKIDVTSLQHETDSLPIEVGVRSFHCGTQVRIQRPWNNRAPRMTRAGCADDLTPSH